MIKKLKELIAFVGLDYKKEMIKFILVDSIISISAVIILFLFKNILVSIFVLLLSMIIDYLFIYLYQNKKRVILQRLVKSLSISIFMKNVLFLTLKIDIGIMVDTFQDHY